MKAKNMIAKIGEVGVDSGQLVVCDPCYIDDEWKREDFTPKRKPKSNFSYNRCCHITLENRQAGELKTKKGRSGLAVTFNTGLGDGLYDVMAEYSKDDDFGLRIKKVWIDFFKPYEKLIKEGKKAIRKVVRKNEKVKQG